MCATIEAELGAHPLDIFHSFEEVPIASASLAQVHVAYLKRPDGERGDKVAVKVQHNRLRETSTRILIIYPVARYVQQSEPDPPPSVHTEVP